MGFKEFVATGKGKAITIAGGATVVAAGIAAAVLLQGGGFRSIIVQNVTGNVDIVGEKNSGQAYVGENLYSGDDVTVGEASELVMCMDNDKYVYADENTHFSLEASDADEDSLIKIYLDKGSELNDIQVKLGPNDEYKVDTPTSTMAVRGTKFRVTVYEGADGKMYTLLEVEEGFVEVELKTTDGVYTGVKQTFTAGQSALVRADGSVSEFLVGDENEVVLKLNYAKLPEEAVPRLVKLLEVVEGNVIKGDLELQGESDDDEEEAEEQAPTPTPTPEVELVPDPDGDGPDGEGDGTGETADAAGTNGPMLAAAPRHAHTPGTWATVTAAHCNTQGHEALLCAECNAIMDERIVPPTGHSFVNGVCKNCNYGAVVASNDDSSGSSSDDSSSSACTHHDWKDGVCRNCGATCNHGSTRCDVDASANHTVICNNCLYTVRIVNGHTYSGGVCTLCDAENTCPEHEYDGDAKDGKCVNCREEHSPHSLKYLEASRTEHTSACETCFFEIKGAHNWSNGKCSLCGCDCYHDYLDGKCKYCNYECDHAKVSPDSPERGYNAFGSFTYCPECTMEYILVGHTAGDGGACTTHEACGYRWDASTGSWVPS